MKRRLFLSTALVFLTGITFHANADFGPGKANDFGGKRVLVLGIDGCRADALQKAMADGLVPNLKSLFDGGSVSWKAVAGGELDTPTRQPTISGPGWTSICTGVWTNIHNVVSNAKLPYDHPETPGSYQLGKAPHFAKYLKEAHPKCRIDSLTSWNWIEDYLVGAQPQYFDDHDKGTGTSHADMDVDVKNKAVALLGTSDPDVLFLHFDQVDGAGHTTGFTPDNVAYLMAMHQVDGLIGEVLAAVKARPQASSEQWLTIVTTDHGGTKRNHGGQTPEERTIFFAVNGAGIPAGRVVDESPGHTAVAPTLFQFLGVPIDEKWGWVSKPFGFAK